MSEKKACPCCCEKHTARSEEEKKKLINRLKRIEGQIRGIIGMMENDASVSYTHLTLPTTPYV